MKALQTGFETGSTHSPYFLDLSCIQAGCRIARIHCTENGSHVSQLSTDTANEVSRLLNDFNNPHVLGLNAKEAFFLEEGTILVEGQDDVIHYKHIADQLGIPIQGEFFGWGVGGAPKMATIAQLISELGFSRVVGILDNDQESLITEMRRRFDKYHFEAIPVKDVRTKKARGPTEEVIGLLNEHRMIRAEHRDFIESMLRRINARLSPPAK